MLDNLSEVFIIAQNLCSTLAHFLLSYFLIALLELWGISPLE